MASPIQPGNQTLGRGEVSLAAFKSGTYTPDGWRYIGNSPELALNTDSNKLDHFSSDRGIKIRDKSITLEVTQTSTLSFDDIQPENLAIMFLGTSAVLSQTSATASTDQFVGVHLGYAYQVGQTPSNPTGARTLSNVVVKVATVSKALGTDYTLDATRGIITILATGTIAEGATVDVTYDRAAVSRNQIISGTTQFEGAMRFLSYNPQGALIDYYFPHVRIAPNGDFALKGDDWQTGSMTVEILTAPGLAAIYADGQPFA